MWKNNTEFSYGQSSGVGMGQPCLAVHLVAATRCLFTAGSAWKGKEGSPAQGAALGFLCRKTVQH